LGVDVSNKYIELVYSGLFGLKTTFEAGRRRFTRAEPLPAVANRNTHV
jgi:hypothetical protein